MINFDKLNAFIDAHLEKNEIPGVQISVRKGGEEIFRREIGVRSAAKGEDGSQPRVEHDTIFGVASMSKGVTCAALAILQAEGKLSFNDRADKYFPNLKVKGVPKESLRLSHLASHSCGVPPLPLMAWSLAWHSNYEYSNNRRELRKKESTTKVATVQDVVDYITAGDYTTLAQPGVMYSYSNDSFALLSAVVDVAAGEPLESFLKKRIFEPLRMNHSGLYVNPYDARELGTVTELFEREDADGAEKKWVSDNEWDIAPPYRGTGWIASTASDMATFYEALCTKKLPGAELIYGSHIAEYTDKLVYGYGMYKRPFNAPDGKTFHIVEHAGGLKGVATKGGFVKGSDGISAVVLSNWDEASITPMLNAIYSTVLGYEPDASHFFWTIPAGQTIGNPRAYVGKYSQREYFSGDIMIIERGGKLFKTEEEDGKTKETELLYCDGTRFVADGKVAYERRDSYEFLPDDTGFVRRLRQGSRVFTRVGV
ncbi:MAG: beta-lactamase family protein [Oscillospiraceae bacterium]|jgi:CubicO group peptidase (beta-lactamase class C family)|nr:beta-lactamase family protein [Oscillospiraceae bacterium]